MNVEEATAVFMAVREARRKAEVLRDATDRADPSGRHLSIAITELESVEARLSMAIHPETSEEKSERYGQIARQAAGVEREVQ